MDKRSILIVEDEPSIAEVVALYLKRAGFQTIQASDGLSARSLLERAKRLRDNSAGMQANAELLTRLTPPAQDPGSVGFNQQAVATFAGGRDANDRMHQYMVELVNRLNRALGIVSDSDSQAAADVNNVGNRDQGGLAV